MFAIALAAAACHVGVDGVRVDISADRCGRGSGRPDQPFARFARWKISV
jgi:hypothetical protein